MDPAAADAYLVAHLREALLNDGLLADQALDVVVVSDLTGCLPVSAVGYELSADQVQHATLATIAHAIGSVTSAADLLGRVEAEAGATGA